MGFNTSSYVLTAEENRFLKQFDFGGGQRVKDQTLTPGKLFRKLKGNTLREVVGVDN